MFRYCILKLFFVFGSIFNFSAHYICFYGIARCDIFILEGVMFTVPKIHFCWVLCVCKFWWLFVDVAGVKFPLSGTDIFPTANTSCSLQSVTGAAGSNDSWSDSLGWPFTHRSTTQTFYFFVSIHSDCSWVHNCLHNYLVSLSLSCRNNPIIFKNCSA